MLHMRLGWRMEGELEDREWDGRIASNRDLAGMGGERRMIAVCSSATLTVASRTVVHFVPFVPLVAMATFVVIDTPAGSVIPKFPVTTAVENTLLP